jgi:hypothetical protein
VNGTAANRVKSACGRHESWAQEKRSPARPCHTWTCRSARRLCNQNPRWSEARFLLRNKSFTSLQVSVSVSPSSEPVKLQLIGWRHVTRKHDALPFTPTVCALLTWVSQKHSDKKNGGHSE